MHKPAIPSHLSKGFTLLEVVIAIAIFAVIGLGSWQVLDRVITSKQQVEIRSEQLRQLQKTMWLISRDIRNLVNRPIRDNAGQLEAPVSSLITGHNLSLTRSGWSNPLDESRSTLQRVAYALESGDDGAQLLVRYYWPVLDRAPNAEPKKQVVLGSINHFEVQFIDKLGEPQFYWPVDDQGSQDPESSPLPAGILLRMDVPPFGEIERLYALQDIEEQSR